MAPAAEELFWITPRHACPTRLVCTGCSKLLTFSDEQDVVKEVIGLWGWLQQRNGRGVLEGVRGIAKVLNDGKGGGGVQAGGDLIHEQHPLGAHNHLACNNHM